MNNIEITCPFCNKDGKLYIDLSLAYMIKSKMKAQCPHCKSFIQLDYKNAKEVE